MDHTHNERVQFRIIVMQCCSHILCWVNPRFPTYCPACGKTVYPDVMHWVVERDDEAWLRYDFRREAR